MLVSPQQTEGADRSRPWRPKLPGGPQPDRNAGAATSILIFDVEGRLIEADGALCSEAGARPDRLLGKPAEDVILELLPGLVSFAGAPVSATRARACEIAGMWDGAGAAPLEAETKSGRWLSCTSHAHPSGGCMLFGSDITALKRDQHTILRAAIESLSEGFALYDANARLVLCNERYREFHRASGDVLKPGVSWHDLLRAAIARGQYPEAVGRVEEWIAEHDAKRREFGKRHAYEAADGRWMESVSTETSLGGFVITRSDITERKKLEFSQTNREDQLRFVIENHPMPVWMNDARTGEILHESRAAAELFGRAWDPDEVKFAQDFHVDPSGAAEVGRRLAMEGSVEGCEVLMRRADGSKFWVIGNAELTEYQGRPVVLAGIVDVTRRREQEEYFRLLIENHPLPVSLTEVESGEIIYESPEGARMFGREWQPGRSIQVLDLYADPGDRDSLLEALRENGEVRDFEVRLKRIDGTCFWALLYARRVDFQDRSVILTGLSDQTERVERERELLRARELMHDAVESLSEGFALYDAEDRLVMCNSRYREMHSSCSAQLEPGIKWLDFLRSRAEAGQFPTAVGRVDEWLEERRRDRARFRQNYEVQHADGRWYSVSNSHTNQGGTVVTRVDITERKLMEREERERDALVREVLDGCPVPIQMTRTDGSIIYRSLATRELFGDVVSSGDYYVRPEDREPYVEALLRDGRIDDFEVQLRNAVGEPFWGSVSSRILEYRGEPAIISHTLDITERKSLFQQIAEQRETLFQREKLSALGELLAGVAHELNNPLSIVVGQALLLRETASDTTIAERAAKIGSAADRCARIVKTFLAMARQQPAELTCVDMNEVVDGAMEVAGYTLRSSNVQVKMKLQRDLPRTVADADQLSQVIINLLVNAQHALESVEHERCLTVCTAHDGESNEIKIKLSDNGCGIPHALHKRIFDPFFTTKEVGSGTGIGLAFCHRIVERHGGTISLSSREGEGATFTIRIPVVRPGNRTGGTELCALPEAACLKVLVIDDESDVADLVGEILRTDGHSAVLCTSAFDGLAELERREFDIILTDLKMPELDGRGLFDRLQIVAPACLDRLAFITGDTMSPSAQAFLTSSGRPFIEKPIRPDELRELVCDIASRSRTLEGWSP